MPKQTHLLLLTLFLAACSLPQDVPPTPTLPPPPSATFTETPSETPQPTSTSTFTPLPTATATITPTFTPTIIPTYAILRGKVLERANCRYGPGAPYLYKYGLVAGSNLEIIGRLDDANWVQIQAIGGDNPCWVKASLMEIKGDLFSVAPVYPNDAPLPVSPYYNPVSNVVASRQNTEITITWIGQILRAGDEANTPLYVVEVWACRNNEIKFTPYGRFEENLTIEDEKGCTEKSYARVYFVEKHGYAGPVEVEFPE